jgi:hypothetical protein
MTGDAMTMTMTQHELVGKIFDIAAEWRKNPHLSGDSAEIAGYHNARAALKARFGLDLAIKGEKHATDYRAALAVGGR